MCVCPFHVGRHQSSSTGVTKEKTEEREERERRKICCEVIDDCRIYNKK